MEWGAGQGAQSPPPPTRAPPLPPAPPPRPTISQVGIRSVVRDSLLLGQNIRRLVQLQCVYCFCTGA
eukprot:3463557-Pyramimonas_sp.AAC.1